MGQHNPVFKILKKIWIVFEPILFALIGTEIQVSKNCNLFFLNNGFIQIDAIDPETLGYGFLVLVCALLLRMLETFLAVSGGGLNNREKLFMVVAWLPKATAQVLICKFDKVMILDEYRRHLAPIYWIMLRITGQRKCWESKH